MPVCASLEASDFAFPDTLFAETKHRCFGQNMPVVEITLPVRLQTPCGFAAHIEHSALPRTSDTNTAMFGSPTPSPHDISPGH